MGFQFWDPITLVWPGDVQGEIIVQELELSKNLNLIRSILFIYIFYLLHSKLLGVSQREIKEYLSFM